MKNQTAAVVLTGTGRALQRAETARITNGGEGGVMRLLRRLLCALVGHRTEPGVSKHLCIRFHCARCQGLVAGDFAARAAR